MDDPSGPPFPGVTPGSGVHETGSTPVSSDCEFDLTVPDRDELAAACLRSDGAPSDGGGVSMLYAGGSRVGYSRLLVFDGERVEVSGGDVVESSTAGNVAAVVFELESLTGSIKVEFTIDDDTVVRCDLDNRFRFNFSEICQQL